MSNFMPFGIVITGIQVMVRSCTLGFRKSGAWECLVKALEDPHLVSDCSPPKPSRDEAEHTDNAIPSASMPDSHNIREFASVAPRLNPGEVQVQNTSTMDAGCGSASSQNASHKHQVVIEGVCSIPLQPLSCPNDMIGGPVVNAPDRVPEKSVVDSCPVCEDDTESVGFLPPVCSCLVCEEDRENNFLLDLRLDGRNVVLDSTCPHIVPHIVITPPVSYTDDFYTPNNNRVDIQWPYFLNVPHLSPEMFYHHCPPSSQCDESADFDSKRFEPQTATNESGGVRPGNPLLVFNRQKLLATVQTSSSERLISREVVDGISRHLRKAAAFEASLSAPAACTRFNESDVASRLERPFVWTDPAQPILLAARYYSGISIIESDCPFKAPHIMITDAPPHDPWISWGNRVEDQDYDCLPVYPKRNSSPPLNNMALVAASVPGPQLHYEHCDTFSMQSHSNHSREPDLMDTPSSLDETGNFLMDTPHGICELGCAHCSDHSCHASDEDASLEVRLSIIHCETPTLYCDDEDDLPPFDDWYLSVIERSKIVGA